jgi:hypothetical protein
MQKKMMKCLKCYELVAIYEQKQPKFEQADQLLQYYSKFVLHFLKI